jgi:purine-nucleoside phosphorylase
MHAAPLSERIGETVSFLRSRGVDRPVAAVVTGSGLADALPLDDAVTVPYGEIPGFPAAGVDGHDGALAFGTAGGRPVLVLRGRVHYYEGASLAEATFPIRVLRGLGARWVALLNAAGAVAPTLEVGDLVCITDHINLMGDNPLVGPNDDAVGPRFPDLSRAWDPGLRARVEEAARAAGIPTRRGVYCAVSGPHYETPAEIRMIRSSGGDLVGMSTVPECIVAVHSGLKVWGLSVVTDLAFPESAGPLTHADVLAAARAAAPRVGTILRGVLEGEER